MIFTFEPQDFEGFTVGGAGLPKLPVGDYAAEVKLISIETVENQDKTTKIAIMLEVVRDAAGLPAGTQFGEYLNTQSNSPVATRIANETIANIAYAITGDKDIIEKRTIDFNQGIGVPFHAVFACKESSGKVDNEGKTVIYKNINFKKLTPIEQGGNAAPQQQSTYGQPAQQQGQPSWSRQ